MAWINETEKKIFNFLALFSTNTVTKKTSLNFKIFSLLFFLLNLLFAFNIHMCSVLCKNKVFYD